MTFTLPRARIVAPIRVGGKNPAGCVSFFEEARYFLAVFVSPAAQIDDDDLILCEGRGQLCCLRDRVRGFQCREDPFGFGEQLEGFKRFIISDAFVVYAVVVFPVAVFGAYAWVVQAGGDGVDVGGLAVFVLEDVGPCGLEDAWAVLGVGGGLLG